MFIEQLTSDNRIAVTIHPFMLYQKVCVYHNGNCTYSEEVPLPKVEETIQKLSNDFLVTEIDLAGAKSFTKKIKNNLSNNTQFNKNIPINLY